MTIIRYVDGNDKQVTVRDVRYNTRREAHRAALAAGYRLGQRITCPQSKQRVQCAVRPLK